MLSPSLAILLAAAPVAGPQGSPPFPPSAGDLSGGYVRPSMQTLADDYQTQSEALRSEMAQLKKSDGGKLTPAHQEYLQAKLIALLDAYHNAVQKYEPMTVNANGRLSH